jgi:hypothetical protein
MIQIGAGYWQTDRRFEGGNAAKSKLLTFRAHIWCKFGSVCPKVDHYEVFDTSVTRLVPYFPRLIAIFLEWHIFCPLSDTQSRAVHLNESLVTDAGTISG